MDSTQGKLQFVCTSKNGKHVYFDPTHSHAATHFNDAPQLKDVVIEILANKTLQGVKIEFDTDMGRIVGNMDVVTVDKTDDMVYAKRKNRNEYVPFTKSRGTQPTQLVSMGLIQQEDESYKLTSAWFGEFESPPFPGEPTATQQSIDFWNARAFVWGSQGVQEDTVTTTRPW